ncbi:MAG TPA: cupin domain-containing protein [Vicinamibacterales bacterium]|nr:cupin domain-containing protein [Vicinamibacterales bacterium]
MNSPIVIVKARALALGVLGAAAVAHAASGPATPGATFLPAAQVAAAFAKGMPLLETEGYKIHASRREAPGMAEVHTTDTDIIYVLDGTATVITGGTVVDGKTIARDEIRGAAITGGKTQPLAKGDVFVVPNGVPHQFTETTNPFLYYVVKATAGGGR